MAHPTSFRLPDDLIDRLDEEARATGASVTSLVSTLLDEGLKTRRFAGIVYRGGPTGRRAGLVGGPDVWEVVRDVRSAEGRGEARLHRVAAQSGVPIGRLHLAIDFYTAHSAEIDVRIAADEQAAARVRELIERREQLLSS